MDELLALTQILKHHSQRSLQLVNQNFRKNGKSRDNILFALIARGKVTTDEEAARILLSTNPGNRNYRNAKSRLRLKLMNHLFFLDLDKNCYTEFKKVYYDCILKLSQLKILAMEGKAWMAVKRIPALVKTAMDFELVEIALEGLLLLRNEYSLTGKYNIQNQLENQINGIKPFHRSINECEALYYDTLVVINKSQKSCGKIIDALPARIQHIQNASAQFNSARLDVLSKLLSLYSHRLHHRIEDILAVCNYLEMKYIPTGKKQILINIDPAIIATFKLDAFYRMNDEQLFDTYCLQKAGLFSPATPEWFTFMEYWFLLLMKAGRNDQAVEIFKKVKANRNYNSLEWNIRERWMIYRIYLCYVASCRTVKWGFNPEKFLSLKPDYPKQYSSYGFAILLAQLLFALKDGKIQLIMACLKEMQKYNSAHLDKRHNYRNSIFIRMLEIMVEMDFDHERIKEKDSMYCQKLKESYGFADPATEPEVIPYEKLWEHILAILSSDNHFLHFRFYHSQVI
jgi:hypothetical protein